MNKKIIEELIDELAKEDKIYQVELEFEFQLALKLKEKYKEAIDIRFEYPIEIPKNEDTTDVKNIYLDMLITYKKKKYAIEIKYLRGTLTYKDYKIKGESHMHAYKFVYDIRRLEFVKQVTNSITDFDYEEGYAIVISNNKKVFSNEITPSDSIRYQDFQLGQDTTLSGEIWFKENAYDLYYKKSKEDVKKVDKMKFVKLDGSYPIDWREYQLKNPIKGNKNTNKTFKYMVVQVPNN